MTTEILTSTTSQFVVPVWAQEHLFLSPDTPFTWAPDTAHAEVRLYTRAPSLSTDLFKVKSLEELDSKSGWLPITGSIVPISDRREMGFLNFGVTYSGTQQALILTLHDGTPALLEEGYGWQVSTGVPGEIEQEPVAMAVLYLDGWHDGVLDPVMLITDQGLGAGTVLRGGAIYGMTAYAESIPPSVLLIDHSTVDRVDLKVIHTKGGVMTVATEEQHYYSAGDRVQIVTLYNNTIDVKTLRIERIIDDYNFEGFTDISAETNVDIRQMPGAEIYAHKMADVFSSGTMLLDSPPPPFEPNNVAHVWARPQRINLIANPSFEIPEPVPHTNHGWRVGRTGTGPVQITRTQTFFNRVGLINATAPGTGRIVVESNLFPVDNNLMSISLDLYGSGTARIGAVAWDPTYGRPLYIRLPDVTVANLVGTTYGAPYRVQAMLPALAGSNEYNLRIEWEQDTAVIGGGLGQFAIDRVLVDPSDGQYDYFDGDSDNSLPQDYRWHGGRAQQHFSMWYNNYQNTSARLLGGIDLTNDTFTVGLLDEWTPSGAGIVAHWEAMAGSPVDGWTGNYFYAIKEAFKDSVIRSPVQEYNGSLLPMYPTALVDEFGNLFRDDNGDPIEVNYGEREDTLVLTEDGRPIDTGDGYLYIPADVGDFTFHEDA